MYTQYVFVRIWITDVNLRHSVTKIGVDNLSLSGSLLLLISLLRRSKSYHCMESRPETRWAARSIPISLTGTDISVLILSITRVLKLVLNSTKFSTDSLAKLYDIRVSFKSLIWSGWLSSPKSHTKIGSRIKHLVVYPTYRSIDCSRYRSRHPELRPRTPPEFRKAVSPAVTPAVSQPFLDPNGQKTKTTKRYYSSAKNLVQL